MHKNTSRPLYGSYMTASGQVHQLATPADVYRIFRLLLESMPRSRTYRDRAHPQRGEMVCAKGIEAHFKAA